MNDIYNKLNLKVNLFTLKVMSLRMELKLLCFYYEKKIKIKGGGGEHLAVYFLFNFWKTTNSGNKFFLKKKKHETSFLAVYDCLLKKRKRKRNKFLKTHFF